MRYLQKNHKKDSSSIYIGLGGIFLDSFDICEGCGKTVLKLLKDKKLINDKHKKMEEKNNDKKEMTLQDIADLIKQSSEKTEKRLEAKVISSTKSLEEKIDSSVDALATITQNNFLKLEEILGKAAADVNTLKTDVAKIKSAVGNIEANLNKKVDKIDHNTLTYRVEKLEKKFA